MVIAIDGPAGAGKSSVAKGVAAALGITYLDSGAMYRCVALEALRRGVDLDDAAALGPIAVGAELNLSRPELREPEVTEAASRVSVHPQVREAMVARQRELIAGGDFVAEGRDIGTVVCPDAPLKVYLTATEKDRARRRAAESGEQLGEVLVSQRRRDRRDRKREHGTLRAAGDAIELDTSNLTLDAAVSRVVELARERGLA
jgi:cytidylate kinase